MKRALRERLSLRARLLAAVGAIVLVAFTLADLVVYGALGSYLDRQVDATLETSHRAVEAMADDPEAAMSGGGFFVPYGPGSTGPGSTGPGSTGPGSTGPGSTTAGTYRPNQGRPGKQAQPGEGSTGPGNPGGQSGSAFCAIGRESAPGMFIEVRTPSGQVVTGAAGLEECAAFQPGRASYAPQLPARITGFKQTTLGTDEPTVYFTTSSTGSGGPAFRARASELADGDVLVLATPISSVTNTLSQLVVVELIVTGGALLAALALGLWLLRVGLRPLRDIERTAEAIAGGDLMHRAPNANPHTEVGHLATAFNVMLERVEGLFSDLRASESRLRRFVGDASHELRTPIAAVSAYTQLFGRGAVSRPGDLERAMTGIERESARMARLVEDLLTLARLDEGNQLAREPVELVDLVVEACETSRVVGAAWPVRFEADEAVEVLGDRSSLRQVIDNLLANVRAHTPPGTEMTVKVGQDDHEAWFEVADNGPGVTEAQADLIFERFSRLDSSRSRQTGGAGLGLAIVASIVHAHAGRVVARPRTGGGAVFRVTLPRSPAVSGRGRGATTMGAASGPGGDL